MIDTIKKYSIEIVYKRGKINANYTRKLCAMLEKKYGVRYEKLINKIHLGKMIDNIYLPETFDRSLTDHGADQRQLESDIAAIDSDPIESATVLQYIQIM